MFLRHLICVVIAATLVTPWGCRQRDQQYQPASDLRSATSEADLVDLKPEDQKKLLEAQDGAISMLEEVKATVTDLQGNPVNHKDFAVDPQRFTGKYLFVTRDDEGAIRVAIKVTEVAYGDVLKQNLELFDGSLKAPLSRRSISLDPSKDAAAEKLKLDQTIQAMAAEFVAKVEKSQQGVVTKEIKVFFAGLLNSKAYAIPGLLVVEIVILLIRSVVSWIMASAVMLLLKTAFKGWLKLPSYLKVASLVALSYGLVVAYKKVKAKLPELIPGGGN